MDKKVWVIIPSFKPDVRLRLLLEMLIKQSYPPSGIHVINTGREYWQDWLLPDKCNIPIRVTHISLQEFDHGGTRHYGATETLADFLLFMTQDAVPADENLIERLAEALNGEESSAAAYARQLPVTKDVISDYSRGLKVPLKDILVDEIECYTRQFNYPDVSAVKSQADIKILGIKTFFLSDVCAMYKKAVYDAVGGFVSPTIFNEDMIFAADAIKSGFSVVYAADARVYHSHRYNLRQLFKRNFDMGVSQKQYADRFEGISSEKEGVHFVMTSAGHLLKKGYFYLLPRLFLSSAAKYAGYFLGKHYESLPDKLILKCTSGKAYWMKERA